MHKGKKHSGSESHIKILCPKCLDIRPREGHHIYPQEFWGSTEDGNVEILYLCRTCHWGLQRIVHFAYLEKEQILQLTREWLLQ